MASGNVLDIQSVNEDNRQLWRFRTNRLRSLAVLIGVIAVVLLFTNLSTYPQPWIDEGYLTATARTIATQGYYTPLAPSNVPEFDPTISTGPTLIIPVAIAFKLFGVGLIQARVVAAVAGLLTLAVIAVLARRIVGNQAAFIMVVLTLAGTPDRFMSFVPMSRHMLGEVTAIGLCLYGIWLWIRACDLGKQHWWQFVIAGCSLGLAVITKPQLLMAIPPAFVLIILLERIWYQIASWRAWIWTGCGITVIVVGWVTIQGSIIGFEQLIGYYLKEQASMAAQVMNDSSQYIRRALGTLWRAGFLLWGVPGVIYAGWLVRQRTIDGFIHAWLLLTWACWACWMVLFSVGWSRYGFIAALLPLFWTSGLIYKLFLSWSGIRRIILVLAVMIGITINGVANITPIFVPQDHSAQAFSAYLRENIPHDSTILSWEWELEILAPQQFQYPSPSAWYEIVELVQSNTSIPKQFIDPSTAMSVDYIIDGPFSSWTTVFREYIISHSSRVTKIGPYSLYEVQK
jgi:4-amino-4-deoxy-L-arabinose transferase-like glycosyltransferase